MFVTFWFGCMWFGTDITPDNWKFTWKKKKLKLQSTWMNLD